MRANKIGTNLEWRNVQHQSVIAEWGKMVEKCWNSSKK